MSEIKDLIEETKKQLLHLQSLGVAGVKLTDQIERPAIKPAITQTIATPRVETRQPAPLPKQQTSSSASGFFGDVGPASQTLAASTETFELIREDIGDCTRCPLYQQRTTVVHT